MTNRQGGQPHKTSGCGGSVGGNRKKPVNPCGNSIRAPLPPGRTLCTPPPLRRSGQEKSPTGVISREACSTIRFYDSLSALRVPQRAGIYRQRTEENILKAQLVNFHSLTKSRFHFNSIPLPTGNRGCCGA